MVFLPQRFHPKHLATVFSNLQIIRMEHEFHHWLKAQTTPDSAQPEILVGIGDDAAILKGNSDSVVLATDTIAEGTHFDLSIDSLDLVGRKSLAVNLSDLAAMAAQPLAAVLTFLLPRNSGGAPFGLDQAKQIYSGIAKLANEYDVAIIGGDTNTWDGPLVVGATVVGRRDPAQSGWAIDGARAGDSILVSGSFGGSIHGRHLSFTPRIALANYLSKHYSINAATDVSDSLSVDLNQLARASGVGVDFDPRTIPISTDVRPSKTKTSLEHALSDGEDFELVLAVSQNETDRLMSDKSLPCPITIIGTATDTHDGLRALSEDGSWIDFKPVGYIH